MDLEGKVAIVTGATGGIGFSISKKLIEKGVAAIAIVDMSDNCQQIADQLNEIAEQQVATPFQGDVTNGKFRETVFSAMRTRFGQPRICVPAAGILRDAMAVKLRRQTADTEAPHEPVADIYPEALFRQVLEVNLLHPSYWAMQMIAGIIEERAARNLGPWQQDEALQGSIVLIGSVSSRGNRGQVSYSAAKSGLNAVAATLNAEGLYHGIQTKIIHPGFVATAMTDAMPDQYFEEKIKPLVGLGRLIHADEIADAVICLMENPVISGQLWADASLRPMI